jgi:hypothetical protein
MCVEAALKARSNLLGPKVLESPLLGYNAVQGGFEGTSVGKEASKDESDVLNKRCKIPTASTAPSLIRRFAGLSCGRYCHELSTAMNHYRLLSRVPPAYRSHGHLLFSGCFMSLLTTAVGAVDTSRVLSGWFVLLSEVRLWVSPSAETIAMYLLRHHQLRLLRWRSKELSVKELGSIRECRLSFCPYPLTLVKGEFRELPFDKVTETMKPRSHRPGLSVAGRIPGG